MAKTYKPAKFPNGTYKPATWSDGPKHPPKEHRPKGSGWKFGEEVKRKQKRGGFYKP